jgi:trehalose 6-phosphate synthase
VVAALCSYDLVGFQTENDANNFSRYLANEVGLKRASAEGFRYEDRTVNVGIFPVGVETEAFSRLARRATGSQFVAGVMASMAGRALIIGVDRLDYSKGIPERLNAFERFLANFQDWRGLVTYLQITPRSRTDIREYADIGRLVGEAVGRINGTFGEASWTPLRYINKAHSRSALAGLYRAARVGLVTPLRDGMNLVAKEFVAAQDPEDPGVLVLSRFAGAARECGAALLVNPYDSEGVAIAINRALSMSVEERRMRHQANFAMLVKNDLSHWAERFLGLLEGVVPAAAAATLEPMPRRVAQQR